jgi:hypothetical protein
MSPISVLSKPTKLRMQSLVRALLAVGIMGWTGSALATNVTTDQTIPLTLSPTGQTVPGPESGQKVTPGALLTPDAQPYAAAPRPVVAPAAAKTESTVAKTESAASSTENVQQRLRALGVRPALTINHAEAEKPMQNIQRGTPKPSHRWIPPVGNHPVKTRKSSQEEVPADAIVLSNNQLNLIKFPDGIKHIWFPAGTPLMGKPVYFDRNHDVMLQFQAGTTKSVQMMVELANGEVLSRTAVLRRMPGAVITMGGGGAIVQADNAPVSITEPTAPDTTGMAAVKVLQQAVQGIVPEGFVPAPLPAVATFTTFTAHPIMAWQNNDQGLTLYVFSLVANGGKCSVVTPPEFYTPGVESVLLTEDRVSAGNSPLLYIVEASHGG